MLDATRELLARLDPLSSRDRTARLVAWARTAPGRAAVCADLREQGDYERRLALTASIVVDDRAGIEAATHDPVPGLRGAALGAALRAGILAGRVGDLSAAERRRVYRTLRRLRRSPVADGLIGEIRELYGDAEAAAVLPACGASTVRALLPGLEHLVSLEALARRHPDVYLDRVAERLEAAGPEGREEIWNEPRNAILDCDPARVLDLLERYAPEEWLPGPLTAYGKLAGVSPERVARLIAAPRRAVRMGGRRLPPAVVRRLTGLPTELLVPLFRLVRHEAGPFAALLRAFAPARRGELYDAALAVIDITAFRPGAAVLEVLPAAVRHREAARVLALPKTREREASVREWSAFLPWPDASAALESALRAGDAEVRASAYRLLIQAARRSRDRQVVAEVVSRLGRLRNEQDPVRAAALNALTGIAPLLTEESAPALTGIVTDAVEARDASAATSSALASLAAATLQQHIASPALTDWALLTIDLIGSASRVPVLRRFDSVLRRGQEAMVVDRLHGWVAAAMDRDWYGPLFALTGALGKRAWRVPALQDLLRKAIGPGTREGVARTAIDLWLSDPRARGSRVAAVLAIDPTAIVIPEVWRTVSSSRTDLLDEVLGRPPRGRFLQAEVRWVPGYPWRADRWLPRQRAAFVALQELVIDDASAPVWARAGALQAAARVPGAGFAVVRRYVSASEVVVAEAALGALPWTDRPDEALSVLLGFADGDRARVALYAAGRAVRFVEPSRVAALLGGVLLGEGKVTSRKAAARLLAEYGPPAVLSTLLDAYPSAHRDLKAAIVAGARLRLDLAPSWEILSLAGEGSREEVRAVLVAGPPVVPEHHRPRYAGLVVGAGRSSDREIRRVALDELPRWARWAPGAAVLIQDRLVDLGDGLDVGAAGRLLDGLRWVEGAGATFTDALRRLADRDATDERPDDTVADRPARRRISVLLAAAVSGTRSRPGLIDGARRLAERPVFTAVAATALVGLGRLDNLDEIADLCGGRPALAVAAAGRVAVRLRGLPDLIDAARLHGVVRRLAGRGDLAGGLFAVALVRPGATFEWSAPWRDLLVSLRAHPDADVREEAYAIDMG